MSNMLVNDAKMYLRALMEQCPTKTTMLWGAPGIGKSDIVASIAEEKGIPLIDVRLGQINAVDLNGIPFPNRETGRAEWMPAAFLPDEKRDGEEGILLLDEISSAPQAIQVAAYQLVLNRKVGTYEVPKKWFIVAAGNRQGDRGIVFKMSSALCNRMLHFELEADLEDWKTWAYSHGISTQVVSFLNFRPALLHAFPKATEEIKAFPTPRTWATVSDLLKINVGDNFPLIASAVGEGPAIEFKSFVEIFSELPNIEEILSTGKSNIKPQDPALCYAICGAIVSNLTAKYKAGKLNDSHFNNMFKYLEDYLATEMATLCIIDLAKTEVNPALTVNKKYSTWMVKNIDDLT